MEDNVEGKEQSVETSHESNENQGNENKQEDSKPIFDPNIFTSSDEPSSLNSDENNSNESNSQANVDTANDSSDNDSTNGDFSWDTVSSSADTQDNQSESNANAESGNNESDSNEASNNDLEQNALSGDAKDENTNVDYTAIATRLGMQEADPKEIQERIDNLIDENQQLKQNRTSGINNEKIENFSNLKKLEDKELLKRSLSAQKLSQDDMDKQMELWEDQGAVSLEANKVRRTLDDAINYEQQNEEKRFKEQEAQQIENENKRKEEIRKTLDSTDEMFGMKMTNDPEKLGEVRQAHYEYVTEGKLAEEIQKDPKNLLEIAWLWKNRDAILSQMKSQGTSNGRKEMTNMFENVQEKSVSTGSLPPNPGNEESIFDPSKFTGAK